MFIEAIKDAGLAHMSYVIGDGRTAAVIDPRRDFSVYLEAAARHGVNITHIFDTHRNEDFVHGSPGLAARSGAQIHHGAALDFGYGKAVHEGDSFEFGDVRLSILETPGHTEESISIVASHTAVSDEPIAVFTGDALFVGDVGRTDFYPDRAREVAGKLYDSLFDKLLPLGDQVVLYPAHTAGSVCGGDMVDREFSTLGYEREHNPRLQLSRDEFVQAKLDENHYQPPYFRQMEKLNKAGPDSLPSPPEPRLYTPNEFAAAGEDGLIFVDVREPEAFCGVHVPGAVLLPVNMLPSFAGWLLPYDRDIGLIADGRDQYDQAAHHLIRLGYDRISGYLHGGMTAWESAGMACDSVPGVTVMELRQRLDRDEDLTVLDVRSIDEFNSGHVPGAVHHYVGQVPEKVGELPSDRPVITFCGSGRRAAIAAASLKRAGFKRVENCFGSMKAWRKQGYETADPG